MEITQTSTEHALEIACDESGWEGSNLAAGNSDVIAYASVRLDIDVAAECITRTAWPIRAAQLRIQGLAPAADQGRSGPCRVSRPVRSRARPRQSPS